MSMLTRELCPGSCTLTWELYPVLCTLHCVLLPENCTCIVYSYLRILPCIVYSYLRILPCIVYSNLRILPCIVYSNLRILLLSVRSVSESKAEFSFFNLLKLPSWRRYLDKIHLSSYLPTSVQDPDPFLRDGSRVGIKIKLILSTVTNRRYKEIKGENTLNQDFKKFLPQRDCWSNISVIILLQHVRFTIPTLKNK